MDDTGLIFFLGFPTPPKETKTEPLIPINSHHNLRFEEFKELTRTSQDCFHRIQGT